jgi:hypothetical protein
MSNKKPSLRKQVESRASDYVGKRREMEVSKSVPVGSPNEPPVPTGSPAQPSEPI